MCVVVTVLRGVTVQPSRGRARASRTVAYATHTSEDGRGPERDGGDEDEDHAQTWRSFERVAVIEPVLEGRPRQYDGRTEHTGHADPGAASQRADPAQSESPHDDDQPSVVRALRSVEPLAPDTRPRQEYTEHRDGDRDGCDPLLAKCQRAAACSFLRQWATTLPRVLGNAHAGASRSLRS